MRTATSAVLTLLMAGTLAAPAFAEEMTTSVRTDTTVASQSDLACMGNAVDAREAAVLTARTDFNARIIAALTVRRAALKAAFTISNNNDRRVAIKSTWDSFSKASVSARAQYKTDIKTDWKIFTDAVKACHVDADVRVKSESDHDNDHENRDFHLGQIKKQVKNAFDASVKGSAKIDLSF